MNRYSVGLIFSLAILLAPLATGHAAGPQTGISHTRAPDSFPTIIIYTLSTCPHCKAAKEYFTRNNIPFVTREVDSDSQHMQELNRIYDAMKVPESKRGVPLILIGDTIKLQGFKEETVREALKAFSPK